MNEFEFLAGIRAKYRLDKTGDDCAVLPFTPAMDLLLTADMLVEDIDFRLDWTIPEYIGHKALAVSLSDVAAMGGIPEWSLLSIGVPEAIWNAGFMERFYEGWSALARRYNVELVGGDISRSPDKLVIDSVVGGRVSKGKAILRSGARPGDAIFVSGTLGGAAGGLRLLEGGIRIGNDLPQPTHNLLMRQLQPEPEVDAAKLLQQNDLATAAIDISDGLSSDIRHLCRESGVGARIDADRLPIHPDLAHHFSADECHQLALHGGEEFRLLFTVEPKYASSPELADAILIGETTADSRSVNLIQDGASIDLPPGGFKHFTR